MSQFKLEVHCKEDLADALVFAINHDCVEALVGRLKYLAGYSPGGKAELHADFAPLSFGFTLHNAEGKRFMSGGLIYSGPGQQLDGSAPVRTVSLDDPAQAHRWSTHT